MLTAYFGLQSYMFRRGIWYNLCIDCATGWGSQSIYDITRARRLRCSRPSHLFSIATFILETIMYSSYYTESLECVRRRLPGPPNPWCVWCVKWVEADRGYTTQPRKSTSVFESHCRGFLYPLLRLITENEEEISNGLMPSPKDAIIVTEGNNLKNI